MSYSTCAGCGCTDIAACVNERTAFLPCSWVIEPDESGVGLCSACADPREVGLIVLGILPYQDGAPRIPLEEPFAQVYL